jgi:hypothetical protein
MFDEDVEDQLMQHCAENTMVVTGGNPSLPDFRTQTMASGAESRKRMFIPPKDEIGLDMGEEEEDSSATLDSKKKIKKASCFSLTYL